MSAGDTYRTTVQEAPPPARPVVIHGLPRDITGFVGRGRELDYLLAAAAPGRVVNVHTVDGMPGVGKTALVTRAAHRLAERFPDGQFFHELHAHTPGRAAAEPTDVLAVLLTGLGIDPRNLPPTLEGRSHLWRDRLTGKRVLLVLDDALGHAQIQPLLPGAPGSLTLVTSRRRLIALDGADPLSIAPLPLAEAVDLFGSRCRRDLSGSERDAVAETVRLCGYLPLAIVLLAGRLRHKDEANWPVARFAAEFTEARDRLGEFDDGGNRAVRAAFALSYQHLPENQRRLFRRIALHPGTDLDAYAAAALDDASLTGTRRRLEALYADHLLDETAPGRYQPHDLLRAFAHALAEDDPPDERAEATERLLDHYEYTAVQADRRLRSDHHQRAGRRALRSDASTAAPPPAAPHLPDRASALAWMRAERLSLLACLEHAAREGREPRVVGLTAAMSAFLLQEGPWLQASALHARAVTAARRTFDAAGEADALHELGTVRFLICSYAQAARLQERALALYETIGDELGQAAALHELGQAQRSVGEYVHAVRSQERALALYTALGHRDGQARALNDMGDVRQVLGAYPQAIRLHERALALYEHLGHRHGRARTLNALGRVHFLTHAYAQAARLQEQSLALYESLGDRLGQANALNELGRARRAIGAREEAVQLLERSVALFQKVGDPQGEAEVLINIGALLADSAGPRAALAPYRKALDLARRVHSPLDEARALEGVARCLARTGDRTTALAELRTSLDVYRRIGAAEEAAAATYLAALELLESPESGAAPDSGDSSSSSGP